MAVTAEAYTSTVAVGAYNIDKAFDGSQALKGVTVELRTGEVHCLVGENGAGKSTLARIMAGELQADSGRLVLNGTEVAFGGPRDAIQAGIALVHQELNLVGPLSVAENIGLGRTPSQYGFINWMALRSLATRYAHEVDLDVDPNTPVEQLSVAQQQLVEIAHALACESQILILDEPTSSLAAHEAHSLLRLLRDLARSGRAILLITHQLDEVLSVADQITILRDGGLVVTESSAGVTEAQLIRMMTGRDFGAMYRARGHRVQEDNPVLDVQHLRAPGVEDASLQVRPGEIVGIGGLVGSGRTELLMALFGASRIEGGHVLLQGHEYRPSSPADALAQKVGLVPENRKDEGLIPEASIQHNMTLAALDSICRGPFVLGRRETRLVQSWVERLRIKQSGVLHLISSISGGNQQKVVLSKILATKPVLLLLDEPTRGIDVGAKAEVHAIMNDLATEGIAIVFVTSVLPELLMGSDRIVVMRAGRTVAELDAEGATEELVMGYAFQG
jgi:ribose transport system ATP-binding protein